jgi:hypothetical protein
VRASLGAAPATGSKEARVEAVHGEHLRNNQQNYSQALLSNHRQSWHMCMAGVLRMAGVMTWRCMEPLLHSNQRAPQAVGNVCRCCLQAASAAAVAAAVAHPVCISAHLIVFPGLDLLHSLVHNHIVAQAQVIPEEQHDATCASTCLAISHGCNAVTATSNTQLHWCCCSRACGCQGRKLAQCLQRMVEMHTMQKG